MQSISEIRIEESPHGPVLAEVGAAAEAAGVEAYVVGGVVRDMALSRETSDLDFVTIGPGTGISLANAVAARFGVRTSGVYPKFGTAAVRIPRGKDGAGDLLLEFVAARRESYRSDSRKPVVEDGTLQDDQLRRDFTINAMAVRLDGPGRGELLDPFDGMGDLERRLIRTPLDPRKTFEDDPLRMVRAARFAAQLDFRIDAPTLDAMHDQASRVRILSQERITDELSKMICTDPPSRGLIILHGAGILDLIFPELVELKGVEAIDGRRHKDNFFHTLQVLDNLADLTSTRSCDDTYWLRWAVLLHDIGKPATKRYSRKTGWTFHSHEERGARMVAQIFKRLKLPADDRMRYVRKLVRLHHRPVSLVDESVTDSAVRRLLFDAGDDIDDLMTLVRADITSKNPKRVRRYLNAFDSVESKMVEVEEKDQLRNFQPPVDGNEIMEVLGLPPGRLVGDLKEAIREAILDGVIPNEHDAAFEYLMRVKDDIIPSAAGSK